MRLLVLFLFVLALIEGGMKLAGKRLPVSGHRFGTRPPQPPPV